MTQWLFTDAWKKADCPRCGAKLGTACRTPSGNKAWPPHTPRLKALRGLPDFNMKSYTVAAVPHSEVMESVRIRMRSELTSIFPKREGP